MRVFPWEHYNRGSGGTHRWPPLCVPCCVTFAQDCGLNKSGQLAPSVATVAGSSDQWRPIRSSETFSACPTTLRKVHFILNIIMKSFAGDSPVLLMSHNIVLIHCLYCCALRSGFVQLYFSKFVLSGSMQNLVQAPVSQPIRSRISDAKTS